MTNLDIDTDRNIALADDSVTDWNLAPAQFRFAADKKRLAKLVRNCDTLELWVPSLMHGLTLQKGPMLDYIKGMMEDDALVACIFNGLSLMIFGAIDTENPYDVAPRDGMPEAHEADDELHAENERARKMQAEFRKAH